METLLHWVTDYGYIGIFWLLVLGIVGLPIPDETLLTFAGYLVFRQRLDMSLTVLAAFLGSVSGITLSYGLGQSLGLLLIHKYGRRINITEEKMRRTVDWFNRIGKWTLSIGYFIPGIRHLTAYVAGASRLRFREFALFAYSGGLVWSCTFIMLGYHLGDKWEKFPGLLEEKVTVAAVVVLLLAVIAFVVKRATKKKKLP